ncbi:MAG: preprotein translocase subunit SecE [Thermoguttaceae bacterium]
MGAFFQELVSVGVYKRTQGRITRQVTFFGLALTIALGLWRLSTLMSGTLQFALPLALLLITLWVCFRMVNVPAFADFLIAVEAEMNKVSWPTRSELFRASLVVLVMIFSLAVILFGFDWFWRVFFVWTGLL